MREIRTSRQQSFPNKDSRSTVRPEKEKVREVVKEGKKREWGRGFDSG